ncbi:MAG TPA: cache domain-containing protein [Marmoricola sp.]|nr:cache domain-containing protein [Marmoricola sp.]
MSADVAAVLAALDELTGRAFGICQDLADAVADIAGSGELTRASLKPVGDLAAEAIVGNEPLLQGAGFVAAVDEVTDAHRWLEWFGTDPDGRPQRLAVQADPSGEYFYDYTVMDWFAIPQATGRRHVTGPYVDYLCTNDYTLTFTVPVTVGGRFLGVAGCDVGVGTAERALLPAMRAAAGRLVVANRDGRVLASNNGQHMSGDLVREPDVAEVWEPGWPGLHRHADLPLAVVELP